MISDVNLIFILDLIARRELIAPAAVIVIVTMLGRELLHFQQA